MFSRRPRKGLVLKRAAKAAVRPATRRFFFWTDRHIEAAVNPLYAQVGRHEGAVAALPERFGQIEAEVAGLQRALPQILEALSQQNAWVREARRKEVAREEALALLGTELRQEFDATLEQRIEGLRGLIVELEKSARDALAFEARDREALSGRLDDVDRALAARIGAAEQRIEFVRRELAFEFRYGGQSERREEVQGRVVNNAKLLQQQGNIRLNLGCGHIPLDEYVNVDMRELDGVDVVADVHNLPFEKGTVAEVHSAHVLEHFPVEELSRQLLPYLYDLLQAGGTFSAVVPDAVWMIDEFAKGAFSFDELRLVTFGDQEYEGDYHFTMFDEAELERLLTQAGFTNVQFPVRGRRNGVCYEMHVTAKKPAYGQASA